MRQEIFGDFYNPTRALSYGRPFIICMGSRSLGKSTGWMMEAIDHYLDTGKKFIYIRRTDDEVNGTAETCCDNAVSILRDFGYNIDRITTKGSKVGGHFYLHRQADVEDKGEECGYYIALSMTYKVKSADFSEYDRIIYDEFMVTDSSLYLGSSKNPLFEWTRCMEFYRTVDRRKGQAFRNETRFIFIANIATYYCPVLMGFGIDKYLTAETKTLAPKDKLWIVEQISEVEATKHIDQSWASQVEDAATRAYNDRGVALLDGSDKFVERIKEPKIAQFSVNFRGNIMTVYNVPSRGITYIDSKPSALKPIALTVGDQGGIDYTIARRPAEYIPLKTVLDQMIIGRVIYETKRVKMLMGTYMNFLPSYS